MNLDVKILIKQINDRKIRKMEINVSLLQRNIFLKKSENIMNFINIKLNFISLF